jgi:hypothetical protein
MQVVKSYIQKLSVKTIQTADTIAKLSFFRKGFQIFSCWLSATVTQPGLDPELMQVMQKVQLWGQMKKWAVEVIKVTQTNLWRRLSRNNNTE